MPKKMKSLEDLLVDELKDLYSAENQILKALPKMVKAASSPDLKSGLEQHLEQTKTQKDRLEQIITDEKFGIKGTPRGRKCVGMEGIIQEGEELLAEETNPDVKDAGLIAAAQKVEHYEIAGYGTVRTYAQTLGKQGIAQLLQKTLDEERATNDKLTALAESHINMQASS